jgi:hypothetical protein
MLTAHIGLKTERRLCAAAHILGIWHKNPACVCICGISNQWVLIAVFLRHRPPAFGLRNIHDWPLDPSAHAHSNLKPPGQGRNLSMLKLPFLWKFHNTERSNLEIFRETTTDSSFDEACPYPMKLRGLYFPFSLVLRRKRNRKQRPILAVT